MIILPPSWRECIPRWLTEDCPALDHGCDFGTQEAQAVIVLKDSRAEVIVAGIPFVDGVCQYLGLRPQWAVSEGQCVSEGQVLVHITGPANAILHGERVCLNVLSRAMGIASFTAHCVRRSTVPLAGTRKTTPGLRLLEKYALGVGGAETHRHDLSQMVMIKDNQIALCGGSIATAMAMVSRSPYRLLEVECSSVEDAKEALRLGADFVLLDNMSPVQLSRAIPEIRSEHPSAVIEVSGGITASNVREFSAIPGIDVISMGCLTHSAPNIDLSLRVKPIEESTMEDSTSEEHSEEERDNYSSPSPSE